MSFVPETEGRERNTEKEVFQPAEGDGRPEGGRAQAAGRGDEAERRNTRHGEGHHRAEEGDSRAGRHHTGQGLSVLLNS